MGDRYILGVNFDTFFIENDKVIRNENYSL